MLHISRHHTTQHCSLYDVEVEDIDIEPFKFDGRPYLFKPEYTDEELLALENKSGETGADSGTGSSGFTAKDICNLVVLLWMLCPNGYRRRKPML